MVAMGNLLELVCRARTIAASMEIDRPEATDGSPGTGRNVSGGRGRETFLSREEWRRSRLGKKVDQTR